MTMTRRDLFRTAAGLPFAGQGLRAAAAMQRQMKITGLATDLLQEAPRAPNYDAIHKLGVDRGAVVLRVSTDAGINGYATSTFGMVKGGPRTVQSILEHSIKPLIIGMDPAFPRQIRDRIWRQLEYHGVTGVAQFAIGATDIAIWDILGKAAGMPVYKMLGAYRDRMPVYSMCGWYYDDDENLAGYRRQIESAMEQGYHAVKIKTGRYSLQDDERRIRMALDIVGKNKRVLVDANQVFNKNEALRRGRVYQEMGCFWYEEPLPPWDMDGYAMLAQALDIRMATGENLYTKYQFADLIARKGADVVQPDNRRAGGVTEWMEIAAVADSYGVELASHGGGDANLNMLLAMPNAIYMESSGPHKGMKDGTVPAPEAPGMSTDPDPERIKRLKVG